MLQVTEKQIKYMKYLIKRLNLDREYKYKTMDRYTAVHIIKELQDLYDLERF